MLVPDSGEDVMPPIPSKWKSRQNGTRHVVDKTLGGDVVYFKGRLPTDSWRRWGDRCTLEEWAEYEKTAKMENPKRQVNAVVRRNDFLDGYLCVCQYLAISHGEETLAEYAMQESGYSLRDFLKAQKETEFETRRMNKIIRNALSA